MFNVPTMISSLLPLQQVDELSSADSICSGFVWDTTTMLTPARPPTRTEALAPETNICPFHFPRATMVRLCVGRPLTLSGVRGAGKIETDGDAHTPIFSPLLAFSVDTQQASSLTALPSPQRSYACLPQSNFFARGVLRSQSLCLSVFCRRSVLCGVISPAGGLVSLSRSHAQMTGVPSFRRRVLETADCFL